MCNIPYQLWRKGLCILNFIDGDKCLCWVSGKRKCFSWTKACFVGGEAMGGGGNWLAYIVILVWNTVQPTFHIGVLSFQVDLVSMRNYLVVHHWDFSPYVIIMFCMIAFLYHVIWKDKIRRIVVMMRYANDIIFLFLWDNSDDHDL